MFLQLYPPQYVVSAAYTYGEFDKALIASLLAQVGGEGLGFRF